MARSTAQALANSDVDVLVIGFSVSQSSEISALNGISTAAGSGPAVFVNEEGDLCRVLDDVFDDGVICADTIFRSGFE